jgi:hypothetical protein
MIKLVGAPRVYRRLASPLLHAVHFPAASPGSSHGGVLHPLCRFFRDVPPPAAPPEDTTSFSKQWILLNDKLYESRKLATAKQRGSQLPADSIELRKARASEIADALTLKGLVLRFDSNLTAAYINGSVTGVTASNIATIMAGMKYLNEYCNDYNEEWAAIKRSIESGVLQRSQERGYYKGIYAEATEGAYGHKCKAIDMVRRHFTAGWTRWPEEWPWMANRPTAAANEAANAGSDAMCVALGGLAEDDAAQVESR